MWRHSKPKNDVRRLYVVKYIICEITMKQDKIWISIDEIFRIVICILHIAYLFEIIIIGFFLWICYKQKLNLRRTDAQGQPARASLNILFVEMPLCLIVGLTLCNVASMIKINTLYTWVYLPWQCLCPPQTSDVTWSWAPPPPHCG